MNETYFNELFERWVASDEVDAELIQLIKDTVRFTEETGDDTLRDRAGELLSGVFHLPSTPQEIALVGEALEGSGTIPPPTPPEDDEAR
ncbi:MULTISPECIES: hypothetical protein [unclassified Prochlorococcus]|uniref:hypothetical protein n=1 Tax=unclassified Prochlorococcus TaxID=2627481 RepID=UPI000533BAB5|nr:MULTISPECIES: hypothetical protein [unclassified Prochlorococcus]KGG28584.1 hypothetical protein EV13_1497 [Prochlorococcus sp. MIT 0702]KGG29210.1 hypothetical protein EV12_0261 [Prochlorococcus sp. MIT 0701]